MTIDFEPMYEEQDHEDFDSWDLTQPKKAPEPEIDERAEFEKECIRLREEAQKKGYQAGLDAASADMKKKMDELDQWIAFLRKPVTLVDKDLSREIIQCMLWICEACIGIELSIHEEKFEPLIEVLKQELAGLQGNKRLAMHPEDVRFLQTRMQNEPGQILADFLVPDPSLTRGDFYLKSDFNELDGRLRTRLQMLCKSYLYEDDRLIDKPESQDAE